MELLTARDVQKINTINKHTDEVGLGTKIQEIIIALNATTFTGTPVNAVNAAVTLTISGVVVHGETVTVNNPAVSGSDVYQFVTDDGLSTTYQSNIPVDITSYAANAVGVLTVDTKPTSGDTMTIGSKLFTFVPVGTATADGEISIGADLAAAQANIVAAINGTDNISEPHTEVTAGTFASDDCAITSIFGGSSGNTIDTTETFTAETNVFGAGHLATGADCTAANAVTALVAAIVASDTQGVSATDGAGDTVVFTADVAGVSGNEILVTETMANGAFAGSAVHLVSGVDGTVGVVDAHAIDASYLYLCVADNTVSGKNWRRISLGSAF